MYIYIIHCYIAQRQSCQTVRLQRVLCGWALVKSHTRSTGEEERWCGELAGSNTVVLGGRARAGWLVWRPALMTGVARAAPARHGPEGTFPNRACLWPDKQSASDEDSGMSAPGRPCLPCHAHARASPCRPRRPRAPALQLSVVSCCMANSMQCACTPRHGPESGRPARRCVFTLTPRRKGVGGSTLRDQAAFALQQQHRGAAAAGPQQRRRGDQDASRCPSLAAGTAGQWWWWWRRCGVKGCVAPRGLGQ